MTLGKDFKKAVEAIRHAPYRVDRGVMSPEFQVVAEGWAIEDACIEMKTWLSCADRDRR